MSRCGSSSGGFKMTGMPELTTLCYLVKDGKALMLHRVVKKNDVNKDKWIGVGGHFEDGESPEDCAKREIYEETGLTAEAMTLNSNVLLKKGVSSANRAFILGHSVETNERFYSFTRDEQIDEIRKLIG